MSTYAIKRLLSIIPTLLLVATLVFVLVRIVPGGPFDQERAVPVEVQRQLDAKYHLNDPVLKQYGDWLFALVTRGDLGPTFKYPNRTVNEIIALSLPVSMQLGFWAMLFALAMGIPLGIVGAIRQNTWKDTAAMGVAMVGLSVPRYVLAPLLMLVFSLKLYWFPVARWETWRHMVLPVICAGLPVAAYIARLTRGGMLEVIRSDFIRTARAKGLSERKVVLKHALRGGLLPVVSFLGPGFSGLLVGSLVVEKIFNIPGMGRYFVEAATNRDYNLVMGVMLVYGFLLMLFNALVDVAYAFIDPRVELR
ncbi:MULTISPECIES: ABC transporter permease [Sorangium]|uniref:Peptide ABC transporter permease n=1 Tax=Sorangium cellulosum TaxID=56 RepID=A0A4P2QQ67_SORCE|nr:MULTISPECIES: ABC transporter permease subunit [Sorangium]AUX32285.1 peptide ABC transporter permease [Sorangium cellulosum]WCQ91659.1 Oligopeptide transport system permease protein OppB [Sorangium sp. Soce836]